MGNNGYGICPGSLSRVLQNSDLTGVAAMTVGGGAEILLLAPA